MRHRTLEPPLSTPLINEAVQKQAPRRAGSSVMRAPRARNVAEPAGGLVKDLAVGPMFQVDFRGLRDAIDSLGRPPPDEVSVAQTDDLSEDGEVPEIQSFSDRDLLVETVLDLAQAGVSELEGFSPADVWRSKDRILGYLKDIQLACGGKKRLPLPTPKGVDDWMKTRAQGRPDVLTEAVLTRQKAASLGTVRLMAHS